MPVVTGLSTLWRGTREQAMEGLEAEIEALFRRYRGDAVMLEGSDAGVSFYSVHDPARELTRTMIANTTDAWSIARALAANP